MILHNAQRNNATSESESCLHQLVDQYQQEYHVFCHQDPIPVAIQTQPHKHKNYYHVGYAMGVV
jgi:hypothetical protein